MRPPSDARSASPTTAAGSAIGSSSRKARACSTGRSTASTGCGRAAGTKSPPTSPPRSTTSSWPRTRSVAARVALKNDPTVKIDRKDLVCADNGWWSEEKAEKDQSAPGAGSSPRYATLPVGAPPRDRRGAIFRRHRPHRRRPRIPGAAEWRRQGTQRQGKDRQAGQSTDEIGDRRAPQKACRGRSTSTGGRSEPE